MLNFIKTSSLYKDKIYSSSQYSVCGYKYLRKYIIQKCIELNIPFIDNVVSYPDRDKNNKPLYNDEFDGLFKKSRETFKQLYPELEKYYF